MSVSVNYDDYMNDLQTKYARDSAIHHLKNDLDDIKLNHQGNKQKMCDEMYAACKEHRLPAVCEDDEMFKRANCRAEATMKRKNLMNAFATATPYFSSPTSHTNSKQQIVEGLAKKVIKPRVDENVGIYFFGMLCK